MRATPRTLHGTCVIDLDNEGALGDTELDVLYSLIARHTTQSPGGVEVLVAPVRPCAIGRVYMVLKYLNILQLLIYNSRAEIAALIARNLS